MSSLCSTPAPGHMACFGLELHAREPAAIPGVRFRAATRAKTLAPAAHFSHPLPGSLTPQQLHTAYELPGAPTSPQTIGIVDAFDDPNAAADLAVYEHEFFGDAAEFPTGPAACRLNNGVVSDPVGGASEDGCFLKVNQRGGTGAMPPTNNGWAGEIATDIETAHGICRSCRILLVEADSSSNIDLEIAENKAVQLGANEISNSWGGPEFEGDDLAAFNHPGTVITVASGDNGYLDWNAESEQGLTDFPAVSSDVVAVGGTRLTLDETSGARVSETVWNGQGATGGGCSTLFSAPSWQQQAAGWAAVGCPSNHRAVADVSADGDPYTGVAVYNSLEDEGSTGWGVIGGTSVASPIIASTYALAGGAGEVAYPAQTLYEHAAATPGSLYDVLTGSNGECSAPVNLEAGPEQGTSGCLVAEEAAQCEARTICLAGVGYDGPSGLGAPNGIAAFQPPPPSGGTGGNEGEGGGEGAGTGEGSGTGTGGNTGEEGATGTGGNELPNGAGGAQGQGAGLTTSGSTSGLTPTLAPSGGGGLGTTGSGSTLTGASAKTSSVGITGLALTLSAIAALNHGRPAISQIDFTFLSGVRIKARATLAKRVKLKGHLRWVTLPGSVTLTAVPGRNRAHLKNRRALTPGRYRLKLAPAQGAARTLTIVIG